MATFTKQKGKKGTTYRVQVRRKGHYIAATLTSKEGAERWARKIEREIDEGTFETTVEAQKHTLGEMVDRYISTMLYKTEVDDDGNEVEIPLKKSSRDQRRCLLWWKDQAGDRKLSEVKPPLIVEYRDQLAGTKTRTNTTRKAGTVNRYLAYLSTAFTVAMREWQWCHENPVKRVSKLKEPRGRVRFLSDYERNALLDSCQKIDQHLLYPLVVLSISTGARQGELLHLRWRDVDLERGVATIHDSKNDETRALPLHGTALDLLKERKRLFRRLDTDLVFANQNGVTRHPRESWYRALKVAGIERDPKKDFENKKAEIEKTYADEDDPAVVKRLAKQLDLKDLGFHWHDLRHSAASYLAMNGATLAEIADILGHKTLAMVARYSHLTEQHTSSVVARMNEAVFGGKS